MHMVIALHPSAFKRYAQWITKLKLWFRVSVFFFSFLPLLRMTSTPAGRFQPPFDKKMQSEYGEAYTPGAFGVGLKGVGKEGRWGCARDPFTASVPVHEGDCFWRSF